MIRAILRPRTLIMVNLFCLAGAGPLLAQAGLSLEINRYYGEQERALVEGSVEIPFSLLTFAGEGETLHADARVEVLIEKADGEEVYRLQREIKPEAVNEEMAGSDRVSTIETFAIYAPPGEYVARARVSDLSSEKSHEVTQRLVVPESKPFFSDALLSNHVQKDVQLQEGATYLPYLIGSTMFHPTPRGVFYKDAPLVYFYYEVNPEAIEQTEGTIDMHMSIQGNGETVKDFGKREIKIADERNFDLGAFNIGGLAPGRYRLVVECRSCSTATTLVEEFEVRDAREQLAFLRPAREEAPRPELKYYADLSPAQVDSVVKVMDIWFTPQQRHLLSTLNSPGKIQFLNRFWDSLDADPTIGDPSTPQNEAKEIFEQRVAYADQFFPSSQRLGRDTDRGRIHILFGSPTETIDRPVEATLGAYQIWNYSNQGETFAFGDFRRDGDYRLIYSTDQRFPGDPQIQSQVDTQTSGRESFLPGGRGYEKIVEDIRTYRTSTGFQPR